MNFNRQSVFIGVLVAVCLYPNSYAKASEFTFSQAWVQLQQINDGLAASQANREEAVYLQEAAKALYFPKIDLKAGYARLNDDVTLAPSQLFDAMPAGETLNNIFGAIPGLAGNLDMAGGPARTRGI